MILLELLVGVALTVSLVTAILSLAAYCGLKKQLRALRQDREHDRKQLQLMQVRVRELRAKIDRFIYVPKNNK